MLTWDHRQAVAHSNDIGTRGRCARLGSRVDIFSFRETERPHILTGNRNVFPPQSFEPLTGDITEGRRKINQVDVFEERLDGQESSHGFDVVSIVSVRKGNLYDCPFSMLTQCHHPSKPLASISRKSKGVDIAHINPDSFTIPKLFVVHLVPQLSSNKSQHVLTATEETLAGSIIDTRLESSSVSTDSGSIG